MRTRLLSIALLLALAYSPASTGEDLSWTRAAPLTADPQALLAAARANPADAQYPARSLHYAETVEINGRGRATHTWHHVYQVWKRRDGMGTQSMYWRPAFDKRQRLRARVIHPDGTVYNLDPRTGVVTTHGTQDQLLYVDTQSITAPLPMLVDGAVVEEVFELRTDEPWRTGGHLFEFNSLGFEKGAHVRFEVSLPEDMALHEDGGKGEFARTERAARGRRSITWERIISSPPSWDMVRSEELRAQVRVRVSTAPSWAELAATARAKMDPPPASPELAALAQQTVAGAATEREKIQRLSALLHDRVRYVAVELGMGAIEPRPAALTLSQGYGDCKDKATLLITLLRAVGIGASAVLLNAGEGEDLGETLPAVFAFNHVIVQVHGDEPLYIDATDPYSSLGDLPKVDQGRKALVLREGTAGLTELPRASADVNLARFETVYSGSLDGPATVSSRFVGHGWHGAVARRVVDEDEDDEQKMTLDEGSDGPGGWVTVSQKQEDDEDPTYLIHGVHLDVDCNDAAGGSQIGSLRRATPIDGKVKVVRERVEVIWRVEGLPELAFDEVPERLELDQGKVRVWREGRTAEGGALEMVCGWEIQDDLTEAEADSFRTAYKTWSEDLEELKVFVGQSAVAQAHGGHGQDALAALAQRPAGVETGLLRAAALAEMGQLDAERRELEALATQNPASQALWWRLAQLRASDADGDAKGLPVDRVGAAAALRRFLELVPEQRAARDDLFWLLARNNDGRRAQGQQAEALKLLEDTLKPRDPTKAEDKEGRMRQVYLDTLLQERELDRLLASPHLDPEDTDHNAVRLAALTLKSGAAAGLAEFAALRAQGKAGREDGVWMAVGVASRLLEMREHGLVEPWVKEARTRGVTPFMLDRNGLEHPLSRYEDVSALLEPLHALALRGVLADARPDLAGELLRAGELHPNAQLYDPKHWDLRGAPEEWALDRFATFSKVAAVDISGNVARARIETTWPDAEEDSPPETGLVFLVKSGDTWQLRAAEGRPSELGRAVLERLDAGDLASAQALLDWIQELPEVRKHLELRLWGMTGERGAATSRVFAAVLLGWRPDPPYAEIQGQLERALKEKPLRDADAATVELARVLLRRGLDVRAEALLRPVRARRGDDKELTQLHMTQLSALARGKELQAAYDAYLKRWGEDDHALQIQVELHLINNKLGDALALAEALDQRKAPGADTLLNNASWGALFVPEPDLERAVKAARRSKEVGDDMFVRHTLACLLLEQGELPEAVELLNEARLERGPLPEVWYVVVGRLAQLAGLEDEARAAYARVPPDEGKRSTRALADRYLAEMK